MPYLSVDKFYISGRGMICFAGNVKKIKIINKLCEYNGRRVAFQTGTAKLATRCLKSWRATNPCHESSDNY